MAGRSVNKLNRSVTRVERLALHKKKIEHHTKGEGLFRFRNKNNATLTLPKTSSDGKKVVGPREEWEGDSYFLSMIPREATLVETLQHPQAQLPAKEEIMEQKLILDQPDQINTEGKVEHVIQAAPAKKSLNEQPEAPASKAEDCLLTEDPMDGLTILRD